MRWTRFMAALYAILAYFGGVVEPAGAGVGAGAAESAGAPDAAGAAEAAAAAAACCWSSFCFRFAVLRSSSTSSPGCPLIVLAPRIERYDSRSWIALAS